jgi:hypothetical protein
MLDSQALRSIRRKMMNYLYVRQVVSDYAQWKEGFDMHLSTREAGGATREAFVLRDVEHPNEIVVILGWHDLAQARLFAKSVSWQAALEQMGVVGVPEVRFLKAVV